MEGDARNIACKPPCGSPNRAREHVVNVWRRIAKVEIAMEVVSVAHIDFGKTPAAPTYNLKETARLAGGPLFGEDESELPEAIDKTGRKQVNVRLAFGQFCLSL